MAMIRILSVNTKSRYFKAANPVLYLIRRHQNGKRSMLNPGIYCHGENGFHLFRQGIGRDIPVLRRPSEKSISNTAPHNICFIPRIF